MTQRTNSLNQPIGDDVPGWATCPVPPRSQITGGFCDLEPLDPSAHAADLFFAYAQDQTGELWTYMPNGPFETLSAFSDWAEGAADSADPMFFAIIDKPTGKAVGFASFLRIQPEVGVIEVGFIAFSPLLQRTPAATEAMFLMMRRVFDDLGYRRYEWKCDTLNAPSRAAAQRLGFTYDGLFRQATIYKGRNRDTAWFSILDRDWPAIKAAFETWLAPDNFDADGCQRQSLSALMGRAEISQRA